jgi:hypothetical protein
MTEICQEIEDLEQKIGELVKFRDNADSVIRDYVRQRSELAKIYFREKTLNERKFTTCHS